MTCAECRRETDDEHEVWDRLWHTPRGIVLCPLHAQTEALQKVAQLAYDYLSCADCTSEDSVGCERHPGLHARANRAASAVLATLPPRPEGR